MISEVVIQYDSYCNNLFFSGMFSCKIIHFFQIQNLDDYTEQRLITSDGSTLEHFFPNIFSQPLNFVDSSKMKPGSEPQLAWNFVILNQNLTVFLQIQYTT